MLSVVVFVCQSSEFFFAGSYCATLVSHVCTKSGYLVPVRKTYFGARQNDVFQGPSKGRFSTPDQTTFFGARPNDVFRRPVKRSFSTTGQTKFFDDRPNDVFRRPAKRSFSTTGQTTFFDDRPNEVFRRPAKRRFSTPDHTGDLEKFHVALSRAVGHQGKFHVACTVLPAPESRRHNCAKSHALCQLK